MGYLLAEVMIYRQCDTHGAPIPSRRRRSQPLPSAAPYWRADARSRFSPCATNQTSHCAMIPAQPAGVHAGGSARRRRAAGGGGSRGQRTALGACQLAQPKHLRVQLVLRRDLDVQHRLHQLRDRSHAHVAATRRQLCDRARRQLSPTPVLSSFFYVLLINAVCPDCSSTRVACA